MVVNCEQVWHEVSNYLEGEIDPALRAALEAHLHGCQRCSAVVAGTRNVIQLYGDERLIELPAGYSQRLRQRVATAFPRQRGTAFGWMVAFAAAAMILVAFEVGTSSAFTRPQLRSAHAQPPARAIPANLVVVVTDETKTFHLPGCDVIHNQKTERRLTAAEAERQGYAPCVRCLRKYVNVSRYPFDASIFPAALDRPTDVLVSEGDSVNSSIKINATLRVSRNLDRQVLGAFCPFR